MTTHTNKVLGWLEDFKSTWLSQKIPNNADLIVSISNKLRELEGLLTEDHHDEIPVTFEGEDESAKISAEATVPFTESRSLPPDINHSIENKNPKESTRPAIRLKRISLAEAERYLPIAWKTPKSKRGRKKNQKNVATTHSNGTKAKRNPPTTKPPPSSSTTQDDSATSLNGTRRSTRTRKLLQPPSPPATSVANVSSKKEEKKKEKRKLRALDAEDDDLNTLGNLSHHENTNEQVSRYLGHNGILSQTRKINETTTSYDEDFPIKLISRQTNEEQNKSMNDTATIMETVLADEDLSPIDDNEILEDILGHNDADSLFTSFESPNEKTLETSLRSNNSILNYDDCIEDITNDGIDPPPSSSSPTSDQLSVMT